MKTLTTSAVGALVFAAIASPSQADDSGFVRWKKIIGIEQAGNVVGNLPSTVTGGGQPWSTLDEEVVINLNEGLFSPAAIRSARRMRSRISK